MSFLSASSSLEAYRQHWESTRGLRLTEQLCKVSHFLCRLRVQMRFGELTRAPLKLVRLEMLGDVVECDWIARSPDPWDVDLPQRMGMRHASLQALRDAIDMRALVFSTFSEIDTAHFRVYRASPGKPREMIVTGCVQRNDNSSRWVHSLAMRAKVLGFRFCLEDEVLYELAGNGKPLPAVDIEAG